MANPIQPDQLFNIDGIRSGLQEARRDTKEWIEEALKLMTELIARSNQLAAEMKKIGSSLQTGQMAPTTEVIQRVTQLTSQYQDQQKAVAGLDATIKTVNQTEETLKKRIDELTGRYNELNGTSAKVVAEKKRIAKELVSLTRDYGNLGKVVKATKEVVSDASNSYVALSKKLTDLRKELKQLDNAFDAKGNLNKFNAKAVELARTIQMLDGQLRRADQALGLHSRNVGNYPQFGGAMGKAIMGVVGSLGSMAAAYVSVDAILQGGRAFIETTAELERLDAALRSVSDDEDGFARNKQFLISLSTELGQKYTVLVGSYKNLKAATKETALEGQATDKIFSSLVRTGAGLRLSNAEIEGALYAVTQMISKTKVSSEELNQQLGERLPGAARLLAKAMGVSTMALNDMMKKGELLAVDVLPKLATELDKVYGDAAQKNAETMGAGWNKLTNQVELFVGAFNENGKVSSFFGKITTGISEVLADLTLLVQSDAWGAFFQYLTGDPKTVENLRKQREQIKTDQLDMQEFSSQTPGMREIRIGWVQEGLQKLQDQYNKETDKKKKAEIKNEMVEMGLKWQRYRKENERLLKEEKINAERAARQKAEIDAEKAKKEAEEAKKAREKARAEQEKRMNAELETLKIAQKNQLAATEDMYNKGLLSEKEYNLEVATIKEANAKKQLDILKKYGQQNSNDYKDVQADIQEIAADYSGKEKQRMEKEARERKEQEDKAWKASVDALKDALKTLDQETQLGMDTLLADLDAKYEQQVSIIQSAVERGLMTEQDGNEQIYNLKTKYLQAITDAAVVAANSEIEAAKQKVEALRATTTDEKRLAELAEIEKGLISNVEADRVKALNKLKKDQAKETADYEVSQARLAEEQKKAIQQKAFEAAQQAVASFFEITSTNREQEITGLEKQKERELQLANNNDSAKRAIEERYAAKVKELRRKQAIQDKIQAVFTIGLNTAIGISSALKTPPLIPFIAAIGALQLATALAKPLPEFWKGTKDAPEGPAWVGERGFEIIQSKNKNGKTTMRVAAEKQVTYLNKHDKVFTHEESKKMIEVDRQIAADVRKSSPVLNPGRQLAAMQPPINQGMLADAFEQAIKRIPVTEQYWNERGYQEYQRKEGQRVRELNEYRSLPKR